MLAGEYCLRFKVWQLFFTDALAHTHWALLPLIYWSWHTLGFFSVFCCCFLRKEELNHKKTRWEMSSLRHICLKFMKEETKESKSDHCISAAHAEWKTQWEKRLKLRRERKIRHKIIQFCRFLFKPDPQHNLLWIIKISISLIHFGMLTQHVAVQYTLSFPAYLLLIFL